MGGFALEIFPFWNQHSIQTSKYFAMSCVLYCIVYGTANCYFDKQEILAFKGFSLHSCEKLDIFTFTRTVRKVDFKGCREFSWINVACGESRSQAKTIYLLFSAVFFPTEASLFR